ncbi:hypothetical protein DFH06DRAFT_1095390 [Mycena polygramma]|nr:hypothetical protein DFH06DRAFT_1095390 [Mycena polygramma]
MTAELKRSEQLWFSPDIVILRAQGEVFRVFVAILKAKSSVFADMFTFPQPSSEAPDIETMEGVPVVTLDDDPAEVEVFLKAIFDSEFFMPPPADSRIEDTLGILRLAHKYDVPYLRRRALQHLSSIYPTQLSEYSSCSEAITHLKLSQAVKTILTATEVGALWLLPMAYYNTCQLKLVAIITNQYWRTLRENEQHACLLGYEALLRRFSRILDFLLAWKEEDDDCEDYIECNRRRFQLTARLQSDLSPFMQSPLLFFELDEEGWQSLFVGACHNCVEEAKNLHATARRAFWDALPEIFRLPRWEELEQMREAALST